MTNQETLLKKIYMDEQLVCLGQPDSWHTGPCEYWSPKQIQENRRVVYEYANPDAPGSHPGASQSKPSTQSPHAAYVNDIADLLSRAEAGWLTAVEKQALEQLAEVFGLSYKVLSKEVA